MAEWAVRLYRDSRDQCPVEEYLDGLQVRDRARVLRMLALLKERGVELRMPHARYLSGKIWELRIDGRPNSYRVLYAAVTGHKFIVLHIFAKKSDETPVREIAIARGRLGSYLERISVDGE